MALYIPPRPLSSLIADPDPTLGADLDVSDYAIVTTSGNKDIVLTPDGTGIVEVDSDLCLPADDGSQSLLIGATASVSSAQHEQHRDGASSWMGLYTYASYTGVKGLLAFYTAHGSLASPAAVEAARILGEVRFGGWDGDQYIAGARIEGITTGAASNNNVPARISFLVSSSGTRTEQMYVSADRVWIRSACQIDGDLNHDGGGLGLFATAPVAQQTVSGSRGGNAALASLLTALAAYGLIVDGTT